MLCPTNKLIIAQQINLAAQKFHEPLQFEINCRNTCCVCGRVEGAGKKRSKSLSILETQEKRNTMKKNIKIFPLFTLGK